MCSGLKARIARKRKATCSIRSVTPKSSTSTSAKLMIAAKMPAIAMLAAPWLTRVKGHVFIDAVTQLLPPGAKFIFAKLAYLICVCATLVFSYFSLQLLIDAFVTGQTDTLFVNEAGYFRDGTARAGLTTASRWLSQWSTSRAKASAPEAAAGEAGAEAARQATSAVFFVERELADGELPLHTREQPLEQQPPRRLRPESWTSGQRTRWVSA